LHELVHVSSESGHRIGFVRLFLLENKNPKMKNLLFTLFTCITITTYGQVGIGTTTPDTSSILELDSTTQGMLTPRMTESERDLITAPATGLLIYQTNNTPGFYYYNSTAWVPFGGADTDWTVVGNDMYNANTGNVGVGNTAPTAKFHLTGTTITGGSGGTTTLYTNDFATGGASYNVAGSNTCTTGDNIWHIDTSDALSAPCSSCTGNRAMIEYSGSCTQDQTLIEGTFNPTTTSIDISFDYGYDDNGASDSFIVTLYNETTATISATLLNLIADADTSYSGTHTVITGQSYSVRVQYIGDNDWGASVDNILVTETTVAGPSTSVFRLEDGTQQNGYVLTSDANGNAIWKAASGGASAQTLSISGNDLTISGGNTVTLPSGGGGSITADNGLNISSGSNVRLGGTLVQGTTVNLDDNDLTFSSSKTVAFPGEITIEGTDRDMMITNFDDEYVVFGTSSFLSTSIDGLTFNDSGGDPYTIDVTLGVYAGTTGGSGFKMGSIEYLTDGLGELFVTHDFSPLDDNSNSSGTASHRWDRVYATNGTIQTSDLNLKKNIEPLTYGLNEVLKLKTISYNWKENKKGKTVVPEKLQDRKIGFSAQQLLEVLPETVNTHSWVASDEEGNFKRIKNKNLGVFYSDIIPVTVNAIQEQQEQIEKLKSEVSQLKELVNKLITEKE